ncbi:SRPBCC family protein [Aliivibrio sp. S3MY1]|uniref:SRPBCC family protein n=1 Tax=unclassified Aliivibrio TaxID=2645654 RepID=UPI002379E7B1|nr:MULTISPECIES: SRPBCC family protein [unclassified Aliivibrio]MDD9196091.1 SRPBCC family protein [Aliivibrio sp. S3MY1]MDD9199543.1 SRPBCC family protein [Aliivibrio sp. S2MY1]
MPQVSRSALVPFSAKQMYDLVNDVASYPQFLPGCSGSKVIEETESSMVASVDVAKAGIKKTFTTKNTLIDAQLIGMNLVDGPFKSLTGGWHFTALDETACKVELTLDFEFTNALVAMAFGKVFQELTNNMVNSFTQRAKQVYVNN